MANINSVSNSYSSSLYGSRNVLSGLASGLDTEAMIENSVSGYKTKITQLQQQMESLTWKQDAYRSITDKMIALLDKFTSYTSKTNLTSSSYFNQAVRNIISGTFASKISATGKTSSDVQIKKVEQLATAAKYTASGSKLTGGTTGGKIDWDETRTVSAIAGSSITLEVAGGSPLELKFGEGEVYSNAQELADGINKKLEEFGINVTANVNNGSIEFVPEDGKSEFDISITAVGGALENLVTKGEDGSSFTVNGSLTREQGMAEYLSGKSINVTYNGTTKTISLADLAKNTENGLSDREALVKTIQDGLDSAFGKGQVKVEDKDGGLSFNTLKSGSTLKVTSDAGKELEIGSGLSNYLDTDKTLGELLSDKFGNGPQKLIINNEVIGEYDADTKLSTILSDINNNSRVGVKASFSSLTNELVFTTTGTGADQKIEFGEGLASDLFKADNSPKSKTLGDLFGDSIKWDENGNAELYLTAPGQSPYLGKFNKNDSLDDLISNLHIHGDIINYDKGEYSLKTMPDGSPYPEAEARKLLIGQSEGTGMSFVDLVNSANTDHNYTAGQDAILTATINGKDVTMQRSTNTVDIDGLSVTLKGTFETVTSADQEPVTIKTATDSDKIVDSIKSFVEEYNALLKEIHDAYSTQPLYNSSGKKYSALTEDDKSSMSDSAIERYEEKAKTGLLFGDSDLSALYSKMQGLFTSAMSEFGISATFSTSDGLTQISLDEDKLRDALEKDPDKVRDAFTSSKALGGSSDGLMTKVKDLFNTYASKSIGSPGILVNKAGTKLSSYSLTHNEVQRQIDQLQEQIDRWQTKLNKKIDYYTRQFTSLEKLMNTMNNQSSALSGLMGGY